MAVIPAQAGIHFRPVREDDLQNLAHIFTRAVHETACTHYTPEQLRAWAPDDVEAFITRHRAYEGFVAEVDGAIAGFSDLGADGYIDMLYVSPDFGRRGVAASLLAHADARARHEGLARLHTRASLTARPVFERAGFCVTESQIVERAGQRFQTFIMEKHL